jgi:hypothetical protein
MCVVTDAALEKRQFLILLCALSNFLKLCFNNFSMLFQYFLNRPNSRSVCPAGYFLNGHYRTAGQNLHNVEDGKCCKPVNHPNRYADCYDENVRTKFNKEGWTTCSKIGYYVVGGFRD